MTKKKQSEIVIELIGGIYIVEKFPDGRELRHEIDGKKILQLLMCHVEEGIELMIAKYPPKKKKSKS